jgi:hypothetical protein
MPKVEVHCQDCLNALGSEFKEVNEWFDEFFIEMGPKHRDVRHHTGGIEECVKKFGEGSRKAAEIHIKRDCHGVIPTEQQAKMWSMFS